MLIDLLLIALLELFGHLGIINTTIIPRPSNILFKSDLLLILSALKSTICFIAIIFIISFLINMIIVIICYWLECKYLENLLYRLNTIPRMVIMLVGIAILGVGYKTICIMTVISGVPNFVITVLGYLRDKSNQSIIEAAVDCGTSYLNILLKILIPNNSRGILISTKILLSNIINSVIMGEYLIGTSGLGSSLQYNLFMYNMKNVWMIALIIALFSIIVNKCFDLILKNKYMWFNK
ncbi:MAG: ABC transporter permease subunit [Bacilli bacterium]|nr:ABC transporter permease subunit [Bacilli bacterium]